MVLIGAVFNYRKRKFHYDPFFLTLIHVTEFLQIFTVIINFCRNFYARCFSTSKVDGGKRT